MTTPKVIVAQGPLVVTETDAGFLPDQIEIGGVDITKLIAELYGLEVSPRGWGFTASGAGRGNNPANDMYALGIVRVTIERLEPTP